MLTLRCVSLITLGAVLSGDCKPPGVREFRFTNWFVVPGKQTNREWHARILNQQLAFFEKYPTQMDITTIMALVFTKLSFMSTITSMNFTRQAFIMDTSSGVQCVVPENFNEPQKFLNRTQALLDKVTEYVLQVSEDDTYRKLAAGVLLNQENWRKNFKPFPLNVYTLQYSKKLANSWTTPTEFVYKRRLYNWSYIIPTASETDACLAELSDHVTFMHGIPQECFVSKICSQSVLRGDNFGYGMSHRIIMLIYARFARNCFFQSDGADKELLLKLCSLARMEMDYLVIMLEWDIPGLVMEFMTYCILDGHRVMMRQPWFVDLEKHYASSTSTNMRCYVRRQFKDKRPPIGNESPPGWALYRGSRRPFGPCDRHLTAMALAAHAAAYRSCAEPLYCNKEQSNCCVPFDYSEIEKAYTTASNGTVLPFKYQTRWYPLKYLMGYLKNKDTAGYWCRADADTSNMFRVFNQDSNYYWACRPKISDYVDEPNNKVQKYDPYAASDKGFNVD